MMIGGLEEDLLVQLKIIRLELVEFYLEELIIMAVRVKIRIERGGKIVKTSTLTNSGYEIETLQLLIPIHLIEIFNL